MSDTPRSRGLYSSLRGLLASGLAMLQVRLELLATEVQEEKARLVGLLAYGAAGILLLCAGAVFLAVFLTVLLWDSHRLLVLGIFSALFLGAGFLALGVARSHGRADSRLFSASLAELAGDRAALEPPRE